MPMRNLLLILLSISPALADSPDFRPLVADALKRGDKKIVIPPGTYRLAPPDGSKTVWTVQNAGNLEIVADGVTLVSTRLTRAVEIANCTKLSLRGLTVDYDPLPFTQGKVITVAEDKGWIDVKLDSGYPRKPYSRIDVVDSKTRFRKRGMPFLWGTKAEMQGEDVVRVTLKDIGKTAVVGDLASLSTGQTADGIPHAVSIGNCTSVTLNNVSVHSAPGMGIIECDGDGGSILRGCKVIPGPKPAGATEERLLSSSWDAIQSKTIKKGPLVENCEIRDAGDDSWSVQSSDFLVVAKNGSTAVIAFRDEYCQGPIAGDRLARMTGSPSFTIVSRKSAELRPPFITGDIERKLKEAKAWTEWSVGRKAIEITVNGEFPYQIGESVYCPDRQGAGFVFRNNKLHSPGRVLIKAGDGLIENNTIIDGHAGITVCPEITDHGAFGIANLSIRNNQFSGTGHFCPSWWNTQAGCISITAGGPGKSFRPSGAFKNIVIENNRFKDINGASIVVTSTDGLKIIRNAFDRIMSTKPNDSGGSYGIDGGSLIWLAACSNVSATGNRVADPGMFLNHHVSGKDVTTESLEHLRNSISETPASKPLNKATVFRPGEVWPDERGIHINAHGGGILQHNGTWYWFGEHKVAGEAGNRAEVGVRVYSSKDLYNWKNEGIALPVSDDPQSEIARGCIIERPKVVYNRKNRTFVMWFHLELKGQEYKAARTAVAVADKVTGPFTYLRSMRPNAGTWPIHVTDKDKSGTHLARDFQGGQMARDMTLFVDDDGTAYHIHSSEENSTLHISQLTEDYRDFSGKWTRLFHGDFNEAPAMFKRNGRYYMISSGCSGWAPNAARSAMADTIWGPWKSLGNPARGKPDQITTTFGSQSTHVLALPGRKDAFVFMADRWNPSNAIDGRHVWLPIRWKDDKPVIEWRDSWDLSEFQR